MSVTYDATGAGNTGAFTGAGSLSELHTIGGNGILLFVSLTYSGTAPTLTAQVGGTPMINAIIGGSFNFYSTGGTVIGLYVFKLKNPPTGSQSVKLTLANGGAHQYVAMSSVSYSNVGSFSLPQLTNGGTGTSVSLSMPSSPANGICAQGFSSAGLAFSGYSQTQRSYQAGVSSVNEPLIVGDASGTGGTVSFSATSGTSVAWGAVGIQISPVASSSVSASFSGVISKLQSNQAVTIQVIGDSTAEGYGDDVATYSEYSVLKAQSYTVGIGWGGRIGAALGRYFGVNASLQPWNDLTQSYDSAMTLNTGSGAGAVLVMNGAAGGEGLAYFDDATRRPLMLSTAACDVIIISDGFNDYADSASTFTSAYLTYIGHVQSLCPGVPIVVITQNPCTESPYAASCPPLWSALATALAGQAGVTVLNTQESFIPNLASELYTDGLHPSETGYSAQANWMLSRLAPAQQPALQYASYDNLGVGSAGNASTWSPYHTLGLAAEALLVLVSSYSATSPITFTASAGGRSMTLLGSIPNYYKDGSNLYCGLYLFGLIGPPVGNQQIVVSSSAASYAVVESTSYNGVASFGTVFTNTGSSATATLSVTSAAGQIAFCGLGGYSNNFTSFNKTIRVNEPHVSSSNLAMLMGDAPGASTVSFSGGLTSSAWGAIGVPLLAVPPLTQLTPTGIGSGQAIGSATVTLAATSIAATAIASAQAIGSLSVIRGAVNIAPGGVSSAQSIGSPAVTRGAVVVAPAGIATSGAFGSLSVGPGAVTIVPDGIGTAEDSGLPELGLLVSAVGIGTGATFGSPRLARTLSPTGIGALQPIFTFGSATVSTTGSSIAPGGIGSSGALGSPTVQADLSAVAPSGIVSASAFGRPALTGGSGVPETDKRRFAIPASGRRIVIR